MGDRAAKTALFDQFARVGKALSSGKRLELLDLLAQGERTVDALARRASWALPPRRPTCRHSSRRTW